MAAIIRTLIGLLAGRLCEHLITSLSHLHVAPSAGGRLATRRSFVRNATLGAVSIVLAEVVGGLVYLLWPLKTHGFGGELSVTSANIPEVNGAPFKYVPGKFYLIHTEEGLLALYWKCTHLGCTVPWNEGEQRFHCPCHGSIYLYNGVRVAGPAPRPLDLMPITVLESGDVMVNTNPNALVLRSEYRPEQATPYRA